MLHFYRSLHRLPQLYTSEQVFDRRVLVVEHGNFYSMSSTHNLPCLRCSDLASIGDANVVFLLEPQKFNGLREFVVARLQQGCVLHLLSSQAPVGEVKALLDACNAGL